MSWLELTGCLLLSMLLDSVVEALKLSYPIAELFCCQSYDCIHWINNEGKIRVKFV